MLAQFCFEQTERGGTLDSFSGMMEMSSYENIQQKGYMNINALEDILKKNPEYQVADVTAINYWMPNTSSHTVNGILGKQQEHHSVTERMSNEKEMNVISTANQISHSAVEDMNNTLRKVALHDEGEECDGAQEHVPGLMNTMQESERVVENGIPSNGNLPETNNEVAIYNEQRALSQVHPMDSHHMLQPGFPSPFHLNYQQLQQCNYFGHASPVRPHGGPALNNNYPEDKYAGTQMSDKSLKKLMMQCISNDNDVLELGLELEFSDPAIQQYMNNNNAPNAAYKMVLEWRDHHSVDSVNEMCKVLHDALVEMRKVRPSGIICFDEDCKYHKT